MQPRRRRRFCPRLVLGVALLLGPGCAHRAAPPVQNVTDAQYLLASRFGRAAQPSGFVRGYRALLRGALGSRCRWYPSDSEYYRLRASRCSATESLYLTFGRILGEGSIGHLTPRTTPVNTEGSYRWIQLPSSCP